MFAGTTVADCYKQQAATQPTQIAFVSGPRRVTFGDLNTRVNRLCAALIATGLQPGDRVAILSRNRPEHFEVFGISKVSFIPVPLNWRLTRNELDAVLQDCRPLVVIAETSFEELLVGMPYLADQNTLVLTFDSSTENYVSYDTFVEQGCEAEPVVAIDPESVACLVYTSGTTSSPKGVMLTHRALVDNARTLLRNTDFLRSDDVALLVMPLFHVGGMWYHAFPAFALGCMSVLLPEFDPDLILEAMEENGVTAAHIVPTMLAELLTRRDFARSADTLRVLFYAGSSIPRAVVEMALAILPQCDFVQGYGSTEAAAVAFLTPTDHRRAMMANSKTDILASCGRAFDTTEIRIDVVGRGEQGDLGEILVRSPNVMKGYWNDRAATTAAIEDGWLRTGDIGWLDTDGYLYLVDRKNDMIVTGGENVFPSEVEEVLRRHPAITDAAVFGVTDVYWVERVVAAIIPTSSYGIGAESILQDLRSELAGYKCPKELMVVDHLPRNGAGKVSRKELRQLYSLEANIAT